MIKTIQRAGGSFSLYLWDSHAQSSQTSGQKCSDTTTFVAGILNKIQFEQNEELCPSCQLFHYQNMKGLSATYTENVKQNTRHTWGWKRPLEIIYTLQHLCWKQDQLQQAAQDWIPSGFVYLWRYGLHSGPGSPVPALNLSYTVKKFYI